ncbi:MULTISPECIES: dUTP diphosphatase [Pontibacillus]|uniref:dUTP diphosphatase n=1 Tax=Pontibacillus chungwhensis TaxID=265426 RepID=A0ABY8V150_9BACI|nr:MULTISPECIES: dUTP diphosphatase [Pontibacillus]MCD5324756.1 dUTP diphosphatase [Pontibacillus sp. HN14]WIF98716.1 dUTP diphosphatase [Pontibacillus chungwhensis]
MNLDKLMEVQGGLDSHVVLEKGLEEQDLFNQKVLALQVEIAELANETRCFKFWSSKEPSEPEIQLEEYVDGIHFFLSLAIDLKMEPSSLMVWDDFTEANLTETLLSVLSEISSLYVLKDVNLPASIFLEDLQEILREAFQVYVGIASKFLGFSWEEVEEAYYKKNNINHQRQLNGY